MGFFYPLIFNVKLMLCKYYVYIKLMLYIYNVIINQTL